jgi:hypothetical protein
LVCVIFVNNSPAPRLGYASRVHRHLKRGERRNHGDEEAAGGWWTTGTAAAGGECAETSFTPINSALDQFSRWHAKSLPGALPPHRIALQHCPLDIDPPASHADRTMLLERPVEGSAPVSQVTKTSALPETNLALVLIKTASTYSIVGSAFIRIGTLFDA